MTKETVIGAIVKIVLKEMGKIDIIDILVNNAGGDFRLGD